MMKHKSIFNKAPLEYFDGIPIFSKSDEFIDNYEKISSDHLDHYNKEGTNPFMGDSLWTELEASTQKLIEKYSHYNDLILDVGVGLGRLLQKYDNLKKFGIDISKTYLKYAKTKGIDVSLSLVEDMPFKDHLFDIVVCTDVLEHVADLNSSVKQIKRVVKTGGILIVRVPYEENMKKYLLSSFPYKYCHLRKFDLYSTILLFEKVFGFKYIEHTFTGHTITRDSLLLPFKWFPINKFINFFAYLIYKLNHSVGKKINHLLYNPIGINIVFIKT